MWFFWEKLLPSLSYTTHIESNSFAPRVSIGHLDSGPKQYGCRSNFGKCKSLYAKLFIAFNIRNRSYFSSASKIQQDAEEQYTSMRFWVKWHFSHAFRRLSLGRESVQGTMLSVMHSWVSTWPRKDWTNLERIKISGVHVPWKWTNLASYFQGIFYGTNILGLSSQLLDLWYTIAYTPRFSPFLRKS